MWSWHCTLNDTLWRGEEVKKLEKLEAETGLAYQKAEWYTNSSPTFRSCYNFQLLPTSKFGFKTPKIKYTSFYQWAILSKFERATYLFAIFEADSSLKSRWKKKD